jgi:hypothetical protein
MSLRPHIPSLARKYRALIALRDARARDGAAAAPAQLRALATEFPGALRELDALPAEVLHARAAALEAVGAGAGVEPWMTAMAGYHALMRATLTIKRAYGPGGDPAAVGAAVDALRESTGIALDGGDLAAIARPPRGRLGVFVFARLGAALGRPADELWQEAFPTGRLDRFAPRAGGRS